MGHISQIVARGAPGVSQPMTNQQLADMALQEDQMARALERAGKFDQAVPYRAEAERLCALLS